MAVRQSIRIIKEWGVKSEPVSRVTVLSRAKSGLAVAAGGRPGGDDKVGVHVGVDDGGAARTIDGARKMAEMIAEMTPDLVTEDWRRDISKEGGKRGRKGPLCREWKGDMEVMIVPYM
jgi:hypothetical protein